MMRSSASALVVLGLAFSACAEQPEPRTVVVVPAPELESAEAEQPSARGLPAPEPIDEIEPRCVRLASRVDAHAAWVNSNMLRLELGTPPDGAAYSPSEPIHLVGAKLRSKLMTPEQAVVFLDLSTLGIGVLANVALECGGEIRRMRVMVMPGSGKLKYGEEFHVVRKDVL